MTKKTISIISSVLLLIVGIVLVSVGASMTIPGDILTTYEALDGVENTGSYFIGDRYSTINEYVGGDAYNYIIGSSIVSGKIAGTTIAKTICIVAGIVFLCAGLILMLYAVGEKIKIQKKMKPATVYSTDNTYPEQPIANAQYPDYGQPPTENQAQPFEQTTASNQHQEPEQKNDTPVQPQSQTDSFTEGN